MTIESAWKLASEEWSGVSISLPEFRAYVAERVRPDPDVAMPTGGDSMDDSSFAHASDLYLACALAQGDARATQLFEEKILPGVDLAVRRVDSSSQFANEMRQETLVHLFVAANGERRRIENYLGRGPLRSWTQVTAIRLAYSAKRRSSRDPSASLSEADDMPLWCDDSPEVASLRAEHAGAFKAAFTAALRSLTARDRNVLRMYLIDGVSSEDIGRMYNVHRATVARWIGGAQAAILVETKHLLAAKLGASDAEVDSLIRAMRSQIDVSISTVLRAAS